MCSYKETNRRDPRQNKIVILHIINMGFNKRFLSEDMLRFNYEAGGVDRVLQLFKTDAIITDDKFSSKITDIVSNFSDHRDHDKLCEELKQSFELC